MPTLVNQLFKLSQRSGHRAFVKALANPREAQEKYWLNHQSSWRDSELGKNLGLANIRNLEDLRQWPVTDHTSYTNLDLFPETVRVEPTSGSTSKRKLIPYTKNFLQELDSAIAPWVFDLYEKYPHIANGKQYWSLSWLPTEQRSMREGNSDADFLPWWKNIFAQGLLAAPQNLNMLPTLEEHKWETSLALAGCAELSLISVWSPTFLLSLMDSISDLRSELARALPKTSCLQGWNGIWTPDFAQHLWPKLALISAWDAAYSAVWAEKIKTHFPHVAFQGKGLWSTEGVVTIPFQEQYPLALNSHFYQFECLSSARTLFAWELEVGMRVKPLLTCGNGFTKYRLEDILVVDRFLQRTPCLVFQGRDRHVDLVGEKLDQALILELFQELRLKGYSPVSLFGKQQPRAHYQLLVEGETSDTAAIALHTENFLRQSHHYQLARELGQLSSVEVCSAKDGRAEYVERMKARGLLEGDIKIEPLTQG